MSQPVSPPDPETPPVSGTPVQSRHWPDYRAVWRWHFYAGLLSIPFVILLSITGAIYLFKDEVEAWIDAPYDRLEIAQRASSQQQVAAALAAFPGATFQSWEMSRGEQSATRILLREGRETRRVYVHPETAAVLYSVPEQDRLMRVMFRLHGELLSGDRGSNIVELAASWTIVMVLTGLFLWWPRNAKGWGGVIYPRLRGGSRMFWRDIHGVTGFWVSALALMLIASGLPWAKFWGDYFKTVRRYTGLSVVRQDWANSSAAKREAGGEHAGHGAPSNPGRSRRGAPTGPPPDFRAIDQVAAAVTPLKLEHPVLIAPPEAAGGPWSVKSMTGNRPWRVNLLVDAATGNIVSREGFEGKHPVDQLVSIGIAAHEGRLFGFANQLIGLFACAGLVLLSVSGLVLWIRRRDSGELGAPRPGIDPRFSTGLLAIILALGLYLPLFGLSLIAVLTVEQLVFRRIPQVRSWLGLRTPGGTI